MTRTISGALASDLGKNALRLVSMLRIDTRDGATFAFTDHNKPIECDLGDGAVTYEATQSVNVSDVALSVGFEVSSFEVTGPLTDEITRAAVLGGRFRRARARLFIIDHKKRDGHIPILAGRVAGYRVEGPKFVFEIRNAMADILQSQGRVLSPYCTATFGDAQCGVTRVATPVTITAVESAIKFTVDATEADNYFNLGAASFTSGELTGVEMEVFRYTDGVVELFEPLHAKPEVGDTVDLYRGCSKLMKSDDPTIPTCVSYDNGVNHRGFKDVPGTRAYIKVSAPGAAYA